MLCLLNTATEPAWNLAAEEYLLKYSCEDCFMLWRNRSAVIVGCNQNAQAQVNVEFLAKHQTPVVRRLSGGGAVYHDLGNVNFTIIDVTGRDRQMEFRTYTSPILEFLHRIGVPAVFDGRNDLSLEGLKISGNAQYVHNGRVLHHGTLLVDVDLEMLAQALLVDSSKFQDKAVDSIRQRVTNIRPHLCDPMSTERFMEQLLSFIQESKGARRAFFSKADRQAIELLADEKYRRWEWNYGRSPAYNFCKTTRTAGGTLEVQLNVEAGIIQGARLYGDFFGVRNVRAVEELLVGCRHCKETITGAIGHLSIGEYIHGVSMDEFANALF